MDNQSDDPQGWLIRNAKLLEYDDLVDISIRGGYIQAVGNDLVVDSGVQVLDAAGRLIIPGFVDSHMHLDKAYALDSGMTAADSLTAAIAENLSWADNVTPDQVYHNARHAAGQALLNGTIALRTHVSINKGLEWLEAHLRLREEMEPWLTIQLVVFPETETIDRKSTQRLVSAAMDAGADLIGGATAVTTKQRRAVDNLFDLAGKHNCGLDLHVDESDDPSQNSLGYIAERKLELDFQKPVTVGHCCSLSAADEKTAGRIVEKVAEAGLNVITLPSCNLYLMGRKDRGLVRRGLTRVRDFLEAGVNIAYASDNIRDAFNPFGKADMMQGALITCHALQMGGEEELKMVLDMGTKNPAEILGLPSYGLKPGCSASLIILDDVDLGSAIAREAPRSYVFSSGELVAQAELEQKLILEH